MLLEKNRYKTTLAEDKYWAIINRRAMGDYSDTTDDLWIWMRALGKSSKDVEADTVGIRPYVRAKISSAKRTASLPTVGTCRSR